MSSVSILEQVKALASGGEYSLAFSYFHTAYPTVQQMASMFTLAPADIHETLASDDFWLGYVHREEGEGDGFYVIDKGSSYLTYEQERGVRSHERAWRAFDEAREAYADVLVRSLEFLRRSAVR